MGVVLWANVLAGGTVTSDQTDHPALYKYAAKLDTISRSIGLKPFVEICDTTDQRVNVGAQALPPGLRSTDELMAAEGVWISVLDAVVLLQALRDHIVSRNVRFGLLSNQQSQVVTELDEVRAFVERQQPHAESFNFSVVT